MAPRLGAMTCLFLKRVPQLAAQPLLLGRRFLAAAADEAPVNLRGVKQILAVASGKGGVGKSSISVNLAYTLATRGLKVGILDADIYGPSLPALLPLEAKGVFASKAGGMVPLEYEGVRLMSMGYARPGEHSAVRGPLVSAYVQQLLTQTEWGDLDLLVIDMPPGTGDIHITVAQCARVDAAVVVSTPQALALADVEKGITMFNKVSIPTIAVAENMSTFVCGSCNTEHALFDVPGGSQRLAEKFSVPGGVVQLPLDPVLSGGKGAQPFVLDPRHEERLLTQRFRQLADITERELAALPRLRRTLAAVPSGQTAAAPLLELRRSTSGSDERLLIEARAARMACRSALMWDELTGEKLFREEDIPLNVQATRIRPAGGYAVHIDWSDGHKSLMAFETLEALPRLASQ